MSIKLAMESPFPWPVEVLFTDEMLDAMARRAHCAYFDDNGPSVVELACMRRAIEAALDMTTASQQTEEER